MATGRGGGDSGRQTAKTGVKSGGVGGGGGGEAIAERIKEGRGVAHVLQPAAEAAQLGPSWEKRESGIGRRMAQRRRGTLAQGTHGPTRWWRTRPWLSGPQLVSKPHATSVTRPLMGVPLISHPCVDSELFVY
jgi:hypothetical protein